MPKAVIPPRQWAIFEFGRAPSGGRVRLLMTATEQVEAFVTGSDGVRAIENDAPTIPYYETFVGTRFSGGVDVDSQRNWYLAVYNASGHEVSVDARKGRD